MSLLAFRRNACVVYVGIVLVRYVPDRCFSFPFDPSSAAAARPIRAVPR